MKRKIIAIVLSLALLTSLFVFASPVTAKNETNGKFFDVTLDYTRTGWVSYNRVWHGSPATLTLPLPGVNDDNPDGDPALEGVLETRTITSGTVMKWHPIIGSGWIVGDFGPIGELLGTCTTTCFSSQNFNNATGVASWTIDCEFYEDFEPEAEPEEWGDLIATAMFKIQCSKLHMVEWRYQSPSSSRIQSTNEEGHSKITLTKGTGLLEHFKMNGAMDWPASEYYWVGTGHFAP